MKPILSLIGMLIRSNCVLISFVFSNFTDAILTLLIVHLVLTGIILKRNLPLAVNESGNLIVVNG